MEQDPAATQNSKRRINDQQKGNGEKSIPASKAQNVCSYNISNPRDFLRFREVC
jgi:hypothetical protein